MTPPLRVLALMPYGYDTAPGQRFRAEQWARELAGQAEFQFIPFESPRLKRILYQPGKRAEKTVEIGRCMLRRINELRKAAGSCDVIYLFRELAPIGPPVLERALAGLGLPIVYDFDDAIFVPSVSEANKAFQWLKFPRKTETICRLSRHVIVGNAYLKQYADQYCRDVTILPTTIDTVSYQPKASNAIEGVPVIGWSGSVTTAAYLEAAAPMLQALRRRTPFRLAVIGKSGVSIPGIEVFSKPWSAAAEISDIRSFDIGLMPLPDDAWAKGKCGLKTLQYMALGVPSVSSPVGVNSEIIVDGTNGFLAANEAEWVGKLERLLQDEPLRRKFSVEGRRSVEERFSAGIQAPRFLDILMKSAGRNR